MGIVKELLKDKQANSAVRREICSTLKSKYYVEKTSEPPMEDDNVESWFASHDNCHVDRAMYESPATPNMLKYASKLSDFVEQAAKTSKNDVTHSMRYFE